ncbi:MAG TPA: SBBP repeat-containing protein [Chitinophagales bacterium]|nr:SBBP repeat-containing protein [Chitinophagales bacterium]
MTKKRPTGRNTLLLALTFASAALSGQSALWTNRFNGTGDNSDRYNQAIADGLGNFYCAGYTVNPGKGKDFYTVKLNSAGDTVWTRTYNYTSNLDDEANYIALTPAGEIVVCGYSDGGSASTKTDVLTLKYSATGTLLWTARFNEVTTNEDELPAGLAIDNAGNIFIGGRSDHDALNVDDFITLKYTSAGVLSWSARFDNGFTDRAAGIVADQSGGCIVTGRSNNGANDDMLTISYNSLGTVSWSALFAGPGGDDRGQSIARDAAGNVYVAGLRANASDDDYLTVKYNSSGIEQWTKVFNGGDNDRVSLLKLDGAGNVYVTGQSDIDPSGGNSDYNFRTIKYDPTGVVVWNALSGNPVLQEDIPTDMFIDASGNIYVTGKSDAIGGANVNFEFMTIKYNSAGAQQWAAYFDGTTSNAEDIPATVLTDASSNVWVFGAANFTATQKDCTALKYTAAGVLSATKTINGKGDFNDKVNALTTDASGNSIVVGYTMAAGQQRNILIQKISPAGTTNWTRTFDGTNENDEALAVTTDAAGNTYLAGYSNGSGTYDDYIVIKYSTLGVALWTVIFDHTAHQLDKAVSIVVSDAGDVYVTGYSDGDASALVTNYDITTIKINALGLLQWTARYNGVGNAADKPAEILFDGSNVLVAGTTFNGANNDIVLIKYDILGTQLAAVTYNGASNGDDAAEDMLIDGSDVYVTGSSFVNTNMDDYVTIKYNSTFVKQWEKNYNGPGDGVDVANGITVAGAEVYVTGSSVGTSGAADLALIKYNKTTGAQNWAKRYTGAGAFADEGVSVTSDGVDNIYTTGPSGNATSVSDFITLDYNPAGAKLLTLKYNGPGNGEDVAKEVKLDNNGYLFVAGHGTGTGKNNFDFTTIKYCTPVPAASITALGATTICSGSSVTLSANTGTGLTYQWKKGNANIAGATASTYAATTAGGYKVVITNANGCSKTSNVINVSVIICREEQIEIAPVSVNVSPNPFTDYAVIDCSNITMQTEIVVLDITGRTVSTVIAEPGTGSVEIGQDLPQGNYLLVVNHGSQMQTFRIVKM